MVEQAEVRQEQKKHRIQNEFEDKFKFELTHDQVKAVEEVKAEVKQETPKTTEAVETTPKSEVKTTTPAKVEETVTADTAEIDFSALANMDISNLNLGE